MAERRRIFGKRPDEALEAMGRAEAVLQVLRLSKVDLTAPTRLVAAAKTALGRKEFPEAEALAARAEALAANLEGRYRAAQKALNSVRALAARAKDIGVDPVEFHTAIGEARTIARQGILEDGATVPNYLQARVVLEAAITRGRTLIARAEAVANDVFTAELALDALKDANGEIERAEFERLVLTKGRALVLRAKDLLSRGELDAAAEAAKAAEEATKRARLDHEDAVRALSAAERTLADLRADGAVTVGPERIVEQGRAFLRHAKLAEAKDLLAKAEQEAERLSIDYRRATRSVEEAEGAIASVGRSGFVPEEVRTAVASARKALQEGRYVRAEDFAAECRRALGRQHEVRDRLARTIEETKRRVEALRADGAEYANDVEEMVLRAEREFENGDFVNSSEDLKIATLLLGPPERAHAPPGRTAKTA